MRARSGDIVLKKQSGRKNKHQVDANALQPNAIIDKKTGQIIVQTPLPKFNCLAFEGGGVACVGHAGAISQLDKYGLLGDVKHVAGASGGALAAMGVCLGYNSYEVQEILEDMPISDFIDFRESYSWTPNWFAQLRKGLSIWWSTYFALTKSDKFLEWAESIVEKKMGDPKATLKDLDNKIAQELDENGETRFKHLYVTSTNVSLKTPETFVFSAKTEPDIPIAQAVVMSALFPFLFAPIEYKGALWSDGAIQATLPTKIFDDKDFLPEGYGFNDQGYNPGVLGVKVDTDDEIMQVIWSQRETREIKHTREYLWQIFNAGYWASNDFGEVRARTVIALPDADVDRYDLNVPPHTKKKLMEEAKSTTHEFLQNYYNTAYDVKTYKSIKAWLDDQTTDTIAALIQIYKKMKKELERDKQEAIKRARASKEIDPAKPTLEQLGEHIYALRLYLEGRIKYKGELFYPEFHINIPPGFGQKDWNYKLQEEMKQRLEILTEKISHAENEYLQLWRKLAKIYKAKEVKYYGDVDDDVLTLAAYYEHLVRIREERDDLENKLGIECMHKRPQTSEDSKAYEYFYNLLNQQDESTFYSSMKAVFPEALPKILFDEANDARNLDFELDMRIEIDRKIYLIAARIYLEKRSNFSGSVIEELYGHTFGREAACPYNYTALRGLLDQKGPDFQISLHRLELLINYFEKREYPTYHPAIKVNDLFLNAGFLFFAPTKKPVQEEDVEMAQLSERLSRGSDEVVWRNPILKDASDDDNNNNDPALQSDSSGRSLSLGANSNM